MWVGKRIKSSPLMYLSFPSGAYSGRAGLEAWWRLFLVSGALTRAFALLAGALGGSAPGAAATGAAGAA